MKQKICDFDALKEGESKEFVLEKGLERKEAFLIYFNKRCYAYENSCPHTGVNLNWQEEQFFSLDGVYLQCSLHGALFKPENGVCLRGPCRGSGLNVVEVLLDEGVVYAIA